MQSSNFEERPASTSPVVSTCFTWIDRYCPLIGWTHLNRVTRWGRSRSDTQVWAPCNRKSSGSRPTVTVIGFGKLGPRFMKMSANDQIYTTIAFCCRKKLDTNFLSTYCLIVHMYNMLNINNGTCQHLTNCTISRVYC